LALLLALGQPLLAWLQQQVGGLWLMTSAVFDGSLSQDMVAHDAAYLTGATYMSGWDELPKPFLPGDDRTTRLCKLSLYTKMCEEMHSTVVLNGRYEGKMGPTERYDAYVESCREVYNALEPGSLIRRTLDQLEKIPDPWQFHVNVTHPWVSGKFEKLPPDHPHYHLVGNAANRQEDWGDLRAWREQEVAKLPSIEERKKTLAEFSADVGLPESRLQNWLLPVRDEWISDVREIPDAMLRGEVKLFDATALLGKEVFNLSIPDIAELHKDTAAQIPTYRVHSSAIEATSYDTLEQAAHRFAHFDSVGWTRYPHFDLLPDQEEVKQLHAEQFPSSWPSRVLLWLACVLRSTPLEDTMRSVAESYLSWRHHSTQVTIALNRLPKLPVKDALASMGSPSWVERLWSLLWIGPVGEFWHFDEPANFVIAINGIIRIAVIEPQVTEVISGSRDGGNGWMELGQVTREWLEKNPWMHKMPVHFVTLKPGMGITIPSKSYHNIMAPDGNRIVMNGFFMPKMEERDHMAATQSETYRAMFHLKAKTAWRLWDTRKIGGFFMGAKLELI